MNATATNPSPVTASHPSLSGARVWFAQKGLTRKREGRWIGGVFAGMARRFDLNPLVMKLGGLIAALVWTPLPYIALWILMPRDA